MIVSSTVYPNSIVVVKIKNNIAHIKLNRNAEEVIEEDGQAIYRYESTNLQIADRINLLPYITQNFDALFEQGLLEETIPPSPTSKDRIAALEDALLQVLGV